MRVLAVSYFLPPALYPQAIQIGRLLRHLPVDMGAVRGQVKQLGTGLDSYENFDRQFAFCLDVPFEPQLAGLAANLARRFLPFYGCIPDEFRGWVPRAERVIKDELHSRKFQPQVLVTFGVPMSDHLLGFRLKAKLGVPWIAHFSDPWLDNPFHRHNVLANLVNRRLERSVVAGADRLIFTSAEMLDLVMRKYSPEWRSKSTVLPHSFDLSLYPQRSSDGGGPVLRYLGNFYGHRSPVPLFRALTAILADEPQLLAGVRVELIGQMPRRMRVHSSLRGLPDGLVRVVDTVPYSQSLKLMVDADLLLLIDGPDDLSVFLPSKLIEYLGAGTPIFGIVPPGTSARLLARVGAKVADPRQPHEVAEGLRAALHLMHRQRSSGDRKNWGDAAVRAEFHVKRVQQGLIEIIEQAVRAPRPRRASVGSDGANSSKERQET
jgi:glycosyltransferase involved in cell wall biosynthesis